MDESVRLLLVLIVAIVFSVFGIGVIFALCRVRKKEEPKKQKLSGMPIRSLSDIVAMKQIKVKHVFINGLSFYVTFNTSIDSSGIVIYVKNIEVFGMAPTRLTLAEFTDGRFVQI